MTNTDNVVASSFAIDFTAPARRVSIDELCRMADGQIYCSVETPVGGEITGVFRRLVKSNKLIVLLPAALTADDLKNKRFPSLPRWSWVEQIEANVWCLEEDIARKYGLLAGWFQERDYFHADVVAALVRSMADSIGINYADITFVGSSLGGFGALMVAPAVPGSFVIADIAQTDLSRYQYQKHIVDLCLKIYGTGDVSAVNEKYRDRFSVIERFKKIGKVPDMIMLHELSDEPNGTQQIYSFLAALGELRKGIDSNFKVRSIIRCVGNGHHALYREDLLALLQLERRV